MGGERLFWPFHPPPLPPSRSFYPSSSRDLDLIRSTAISFNKKITHERETENKVKIDLLSLWGPRIEYGDGMDTMSTVVSNRLKKTINKTIKICFNIVCV